MANSKNEILTETPLTMNYPMDIPYLIGSHYLVFFVNPTNFNTNLKNFIMNDISLARLPQYEQISCV